MPSVYDSDAFSTRVSYAKRCILSGNTNTRAFDTCFEMYDGGFVMCRLWQEAENDPELAEGLKGYGSDGGRLLYEKIKTYSPRRIAKLAKLHRDAELAAMRLRYPQSAA